MARRWDSYENPANFYSLQAPRINGVTSWRKRAGLFWIDAESPMAHRKAIERYAYYFKREMAFSGVQYEPSEHTDKTCKAFGIVKDDWSGKCRLIGAGCFRFRQYTNHPSEWVLQWIYFHPCARRRGHLSEVFPVFETDVGKFSIERPLSLGMSAFLEKYATKFDVV